MPDTLSLRAASAILALTAAGAGVAFALSGSTGIALAVAVLGSGLWSLAAVGFLNQRLRHLTAAASAIAAGDFGARVDPRPGGELGRTADALERMARGVGDLVNAVARDQNRLMPALNSSLDAVLAVDAADRIRFGNVAAERLFERSQGDLAGTPLVWVLPNQEVLDALRASRAEGRRATCLVERPGRRHLEVMATPISGGGEWSAMLVFHDITEVKRVEQLRRDFVANVSHELRTPLASIKAVIETLARGALEDPGSARDFLDRADAEVDRLVQLVEELLELSRIESGEIAIAQEQVALGEIVAEAVARLRPQAEKLSVTLSAQAEASLPAISGDGKRLERAVVNLVHNAIKFTPAGGTVSVSVRRTNGWLTVGVRDSGAGIDARDLPRVFERFFKADQSRKGGGSGLGLAIVKHTAEAHGGTVSAASEPGKGSLFTLSLPVSRAPLRT